MPEANLFLVFLERLNRGNFQYMVTGSVASTIYGEPRVTNDIDIVVELAVDDAAGLVRLFECAEFYCPPPQVLEAEILSQSGHFNIIHHNSGFKADIYAAAGDELHTWAMGRRQKVKIEGCDVWLAPPEYVIIRKLQYYREGKSEKHLRDIKRMLDVMRVSIDMADLRPRIAHLGLQNEWNLAQKIAT